MSGPEETRAQLLQRIKQLEMRLEEAELQHLIRQEELCRARRQRERTAMAQMRRADQGST